MLLANTEGGAAVGSVNEGVALGKAYTNMTPGTMQETGEPLDFAIEGNGFFAVKTRAGHALHPRRAVHGLRHRACSRTPTAIPCSAPKGAQIKVSAAGAVPASALGVFEVPGAVKQGENLYTGNAAGKPTRHRPPGLARGLGRRRRQGDDRNDHLAAQLPVRPAGDPGDRPDPAGGRLAGRLAERPNA